MFLANIHHNGLHNDILIHVFHCISLIFTPHIILPTPPFIFLMVTPSQTPLGFSCNICVYVFMCVRSTPERNHGKCVSFPSYTCLS